VAVNAQYVRLNAAGLVHLLTETEDGRREKTVKTKSFRRMGIGYSIGVQQIGRL
jgi:hypothetical protein